MPFTIYDIFRKLLYLYIITIAYVNDLFAPNLFIFILLQIVPFIWKESVSTILVKYFLL